MRRLIVAPQHNPDHVSIVIHNYRWRLGLAKGEPQYGDLERRIAESPAISVPAITLEGDANGAPHPEARTFEIEFLDPTFRLWTSRLVRSRMFCFERNIPLSQRRGGRDIN